LFWLFLVIFIELHNDPGGGHSVTTHALSWAKNILTVVSHCVVGRILHCRHNKAMGESWVMRVTQEVLHFVGFTDYLGGFKPAHHVF